MNGHRFWYLSEDGCKRRMPALVRMGTWFCDCGTRELQVQPIHYTGLLFNSCLSQITHT